MSSLFGRVSKSQQTLGVSNLCLFVPAYPAGRKREGEKEEL
jgi:hypothetical protein